VRAVSRVWPLEEVSTVVLPVVSARSNHCYTSNFVPSHPIKQFPWLVFFVLLYVPSALRAEAVVQPSIDRALERLYSFDFDSAHAILDEHRRENPDEPIGASIRAATYLFQELDRMMILEAEFFEDDKRIAAEKDLVPDPTIRDRMMEALELTERLAQKRLADNPEDLDALFALCMKEGIYNDYRALVEKKKLSALTGRKRGNRYAQQLLEIDPTFYDAHLATGVNEYVLGSLPFFVRWFVRLDGVKGSKQLAVSDLELVAKRGSYLGPFARILLAIIWLREDEPERSAALLGELTREYPENPLMRKEYLKVTERLEGRRTAAKGMY